MISQKKSIIKGQQEKNYDYFFYSAQKKTTFSWNHSFFVCFMVVLIFHTRSELTCYVCNTIMHTILSLNENTQNVRKEFLYSASYSFREMRMNELLFFDASLIYCQSDMLSIATHFQVNDILFQSTNV